MDDPAGLDGNADGPGLAHATLFCFKQCYHLRPQQELRRHWADQTHIEPPRPNQSSFQSKTPVCQLFVLFQRRETADVQTRYEGVNFGTRIVEFV